MAAEKGNTGEWAQGYIAVTEHPVLHGMRRYFQKRALMDFLDDREMRILDVGCGNGVFMHFLMRNGYPHVYGVDPGEELLEKLRRGAPELAPRVRQGVSTSLPFDDGSFDCIYFFNVMHHLGDRGEYHQTLREVDRCLKPGGIVVLLEPCTGWIFALKRGVARILAPFSALFAHIYQMMMEEKGPVTFFFRNSGSIREKIREMNYRFLRDRKLLYQWILVARKPER